MIIKNENAIITNLYVTDILDKKIKKLLKLYFNEHKNHYLQYYIYL